MSKQFEHLEILYKQILKISLNIKNLVVNDDFDSIVFEESRKSQLISKVAFLKKQVNLDDDERIVIEKIREKILAQEDENLTQLSNLREDVLQKIKAISAKEKVMNKYENTESESGTICDYISD